MVLSPWISGTLIACSLTILPLGVLMIIGFYHYYKNHFETLAKKEYEYYLYLAERENFEMKYLEDPKQYA